MPPSEETKNIVTEMHEGSRVLSRVLSGLHEVLRIYPILLASIAIRYGSYSG